MLKTKMSKATDILLEQMERIKELTNKKQDEATKEELQSAIITSKTLNGSASSIIKEAAILLAIEQYANMVNVKTDDVITNLGIKYEK